MTAQQLRQQADRTGQWAAIALGVAIPISVALDNVLLVLILAAWLAGGGFKYKYMFLDNKMAAAALALFVLLLLGTAWGAQRPGDATQYLVKYLDLAFIPLFAYFFRDPLARRRGLLAFAGSLAAVLCLSYLIKLGVVPQAGPIQGTAESPVVFKLRITHNFLMAFAAFLYAWLASTAVSARARVAWSVLALLAAANVMLMVQGATGYVVLCALAALLIADRLSRRAALAAAAGAVALIAALVLVPGPFSARVNTIVDEARAWQPDAPMQTSAGLRLEYYRNTLGIIAAHPFAGVGTGGFPAAYAKHVTGTGMSETRNPHNEYLHLAAQLGIAGLAALLLLFWTHWRSARDLPGPFDAGLARGLVLAIAVGCLFNSLLLDHTEGLLYAWLTGLLFAGLPRQRSAEAAT